MDPLVLSPEEFRRLAASVAELSAGYISSLDASRTFPVTTGAETERLFALELPEQPMGDRALTRARGRDRAFAGAKRTVLWIRAGSGRAAGGARRSAGLDLESEHDLLAVCAGGRDHRADGGAVAGGGGGVWRGCPDASDRGTWRRSGCVQ